MNQQLSHPSTHLQARDDRLSGLLKAAAGGDAQSFESFYDATVGDVLALAARLAGERLEDVLTASYLQAWRQAARFDPQRACAFDWLLAIVREQAGDPDRETSR